MFLQIKLVDFIPGPGKLLSARKSIGLRLAQILLESHQLVFDLLEFVAPRFECGLLLFHSGDGCCEPLRHDHQFLLSGAFAFLGLGDVSERLPMLSFQLEQAFLVEMDPALVPFDLAF